MVIPLMIAAAVWTYNIVKIAERASGREDEREQERENNADEGNTITNSIDAIRCIRQMKQAERIEGRRTREEADYRH